MELKVNIDSSQLNYDEITKVICNKLKDTDILASGLVYNIVKDAIKSEVRGIVDSVRYEEQLVSSYDVRKHVKNLMEKEFKEKITPYVDDAFNKIGGDVILELIKEILPDLLLRAIINSMFASMHEVAHNNQNETIMRMVNILKERGIVI